MGSSDHQPKWIDMKNPVGQAFTVMRLAAHLGRGVGRAATDAVVGGRLGGGKAGLLDWQAMRRGHPARELAYTLITSLTPEDRRAAQRDLLDDYRRALAAAGGPDLDRDDLWLRYRQGAQYGYVASLITAGMGGMQVEDIAMDGLRRGVAALDDLETIAALKNSL
jgi:hypothetical protein